MPGALAHEVDWSTTNDCILSRVRYAGRYWINHLLESHFNSYVNGKAYEYLKDHILHRLEVLGLLDKVSEGVKMMEEFSERLSSIQVGSHSFRL
ncbi:hypothetical protein EMCG_02243 [[Emmonsia] crescens]|uniref:Uncharacterized protein n=1 Tax=[Emmonsia] crescens TaxID=73230 RepID=A0A0G2HYR0_9EURO|nr:hypothetical protein EMCG_02243 [Emmonsia crescens UAMH 3008]